MLRPPPAQVDPCVELLIACVHREPKRLSEGRLAALDEEKWRRLVDVAYSLGVAELVYERLLARGWVDLVPPTYRAELKERCRQTAASNARLIDDLAHVLDALRRGGVEAISLKGVMLALEIHDHLAWRRSADVDLLLRRDDLERAAAILEADGYLPDQSYSIAGVVATTHHLPPFSKADRSSVDLHWTLLPPRPAYEVDAEELWARAMRRPVGDLEALTLGPEDLVLHQCLHASYRHLFATGLRPACDIAGIVERHRERLDWPALAEIARRWRVEPGVSIALRAARDLVGAAVPQDVLDDLGDVDPTMSSVCRSQMLSVVPWSDRVTISHNLTLIVRSPDAARRREILVGRLLPPREEVAAEYRLDPRSPWVYPYYAVRAKDMIARNWRYLPAYLGFGRDTGTGGFASRQGQLGSYLSRDRFRRL